LTGCEQNEVESKKTPSRSPPSSPVEATLRFWGTMASD
jgi:hypothetical protein